MKTVSLPLTLLIVVALCGCSTPSRSGPERVMVDKIRRPLPVAQAGDPLLFFSGQVNATHLRKKFHERPTAGWSWEGEYAEFSAALVEKAEAKGLDSAALSQVLRTIRTDPHGHLQSPLLPIGAYSTTLNNEAVWFVVVAWGGGDETFGHWCNYAYAVTPSGPKLLGFGTCN
jgi:hypothetical protein